MERQNKYKMYTKHILNQKEIIKVKNHVVLYSRSVFFRGEDEQVSGGSSAAAEVGRAAPSRGRGAARARLRVHRGHHEILRTAHK